MASKVEEIRVNEMIRASQVRLISGDGTQLGVMATRDAMDVALKEGLDLVEVAPNADPPVCRIMDYGKFKYEASKKEQEARKKTKAFQLKEIKLRPHTDEHDLNTKIKNLRKFLEKKNRVKLTLMYRGREFAYQETGIELLLKIAEEVKDLGAIEQEAKKEGRNATMVIVPK
ncbi:MAG: translation initiation factor IF-3 [Deltaproteobacteria bacterium]|nr:translation initiation factor IF-3 [Deltaproteobacteria bacterium]